MQTFPSQHPLGVVSHGIPSDEQPGWRHIPKVHMLLGQQALTAHDSPGGAQPEGLWQTPVTLQVIPRQQG
jgi:hypothetical protein